MNNKQDMGHKDTRSGTRGFFWWLNFGLMCVCMIGALMAYAKGHTNELILYLGLAILNQAVLK